MVYSESNTPRRNNKVRFEMVEHIGVLNQKKSGWTREVNIVAWNGNAPKIDIREWDPQHVRMSRGVTLLEEEAELLVKHLAKRYGFIWQEPRQENRGYREPDRRDWRPAEGGSAQVPPQVNSYREGDGGTVTPSNSSLYDPPLDLPFEGRPAEGRADKEFESQSDKDMGFEDRSNEVEDFEAQSYEDRAFGDEGGSAAVAAESGAGPEGGDGYEAAPAPLSAADEG